MGLACINKHNFAKLGSCRLRWELWSRSASSPSLYLEPLGILAWFPCLKQRQGEQEEVGMTWHYTELIQWWKLVMRSLALLTSAGLVWRQSGNVTEFYHRSSGITLQFQSNHVLFQLTKMNNLLVLSSKGSKNYVGITPVFRHCWTWVTKWKTFQNLIQVSGSVHCPKNGKPHATCARMPMTTSS